VIDAARFKQMLYNYVSNALKFTPDGGRVSVRVSPEGEGAFRIEVEDTGIGIAPGDLGRLFVEFQQLDGGASKQHAGTGLGLALTKRMIEAQRGSVGVRSTVGAGSVFHAVMPRVALSRDSVRPAEAIPPARLGAPTVLVIEDDPRDQAAIVHGLVEAGYEVEALPLGARAIERCRARRFDAITLDLLLPDMSGLDVLASIRAAGENRRTPVVVVTVVARRGRRGVPGPRHAPEALDATRLLDSLRRAGVPPERAGSVLVVDDDPASLRLMEAMLGQLGYRTSCHQDAERALRRRRSPARWRWCSTS